MATKTRVLKKKKAENKVAEKEVPLTPEQASTIRWLEKLGGTLCPIVVKRSKNTYWVECELPHGPLPLGENEDRATMAQQIIVDCRIQSARYADLANFIERRGSRRKAVKQ